MLDENATGRPFRRTTDVTLFKTHTKKRSISVCI